MFFHLQSRNYLRLFKPCCKYRVAYHLQSRNYLRLFKPERGTHGEGTDLQSRNYLRLFKLVGVA